MNLKLMATTALLAGSVLLQLSGSAVAADQKNIKPINYFGPYYKIADIPGFLNDKSRGQRKNYYQLHPDHAEKECIYTYVVDYALDNGHPVTGYKEDFAVMGNRRLDQREACIFTADIKKIREDDAKIALAILQYEKERGLTESDRNDEWFKFMKKNLPKQ